MKGLEIPREVFEAIIKDNRWQFLLRLNDNGDVFIDLAKYSAHGSYLPIESEFQSYIVGFTFMNDLYACPYRSQDDLVCIYPPAQENYKVEYVKQRVPIREETKVGQGDASCSTVNHRSIEAYKRVITKDER